jgi:hypothetical protein
MDKELRAELVKLVSTIGYNIHKHQETVENENLYIDQAHSAITKLFEERTDDRSIIVDVLRMENKKLGGCLETILKTIKSCKTAKYYDEADFKERMLELIEVRKAFLDVLDGNSAWYDIKNETGLSERRCKEIENIYEAELRKKVEVDNGK